MWKQKLTSRKLWAAIAGFATAILTAFSVDILTIERVATVITACSVLVVYILSEGFVDSYRSGTTNDIDNGSKIGFRDEEEK